MKKIHLLAMLLFTACFVPVSQAQESLFLKDPSTKNKLLQLDLDVGTCFDLAYRGKGNMYTAMSDRKSVFPAITFVCNISFRVNGDGIRISVWGFP